MNEITFETALKELEEIIKKLESGSIPLEEAINEYTDAMNLVKICQEKLDHATEQVNKILSESGELEDFKVSELTNNE
ncbi:TPA: exodeoxyribonuclease VII small subunit [Candidatus Ventrenecus stercoripullorum]|nr:exodeoxyribonuclease VII small subunit [Candidatus Ventrenecus stercoripullorum]